MERAPLFRRATAANSTAPRSKAKVHSRILMHLQAKPLLAILVVQSLSHNQLSSYPALNDRCLHTSRQRPDHNLRSIRVAR